MQIGSGLTRYRSAPSSYFGTLLNNKSDGRFGEDDFAQLFNPKASSPETQRIFARFMNGASDNVQENCSTNIPAQSQSQFNSRNLPPRNREPKAKQLQKQQSDDYSSVMYRSNNSVAENSVNSIPKAKKMKMKMEEQCGGSYSLLRHSSSPAGLFANLLHIESGTCKNPVDFTSGNYSSGMKDIGENSLGDRQFDEDHSHDLKNYDIPGFAVNPWDDDSAILSDDFFKGLVDDEERTFSRTNSPDEQNQEDGKQSTTLLSRHLILPKSPAVEKLLEDSVHFKARAKRGFATHPRSIAERVRRTKISERVRKLQDLVPNMEKQTNTADMLDLAFDYIKDLQRQVKILEDNRDKCSC